MAYLAETLRKGAEYAASTVEKGTFLERLMQAVMERHPGEYGKQRFEQVWRWDDYPDKWGHDTGIDLVARQTEAFGGGDLAIQCKFFDPSLTVSKVDVDKFVSASATGQFSGRLFVTTAPIAKEGLRVIERAEPRCEILNVADMDDWVDDWREYAQRPGDIELALPKHTPRPDQEEALDAISQGFDESDRGKLILPCGTGKSVVALWAAEREVGVGGNVLYLVPSIALMGQTMREWARHRTIEHSYLGVCSDTTAGRRREDPYGGDIYELAMSVSTNLDAVRAQLRRAVPADEMRVVFCTYQSSAVVADAIEGTDFRFDLIICDEAHRTTGVQRTDKDLKDENELSGFLLVHDNDRLPSKRRLFMTATPRVFTERAKEKVETLSERVGWDVDSYSMDNERWYGPVFHEMSFAEAVERELLTDYQVLIVAKDESSLSAELKAKVGDDDSFEIDEAVKLVGVWDAFADPTTMGPEIAQRAAGVIDPGVDHLQTAIAFTNTVKTSKAVADWWDQVVEDHVTAAPYGASRLKLDVEHIDGGTPAMIRAQQISKLREQREADDNACRVLSNARVLTEGVDVPALDAITFLESRKSKIDITQAVGRVMRRAAGKQTGYIILPVVVPQDARATDDEVLNGSDFKVVWDVVRALRAHDERIDYWVNDVKAAAVNGRIRLLDRTGRTDPEGKDSEESEQLQLALQLDDKVASKIVEMVGDRRFWPTWGKRAANVCDRVEAKLNDALESNVALSDALDEFVVDLRKTVGPQVDRKSAAQMVAQHIVTIPIFEYMFAESRFVEHNPVSAAINVVLDRLDEHGVRFDKDRAPLARAYSQMEKAFAGAHTNADKVDILRQIYHGFFSAAMKDTVKQLGIVYTPIWIVNFILRSADAVCRREFGYGLTDENVNILDPFTGTGTFLHQILTLQSADGRHLIDDTDLARKYRGELHANEIVLLAYYIAALKIEAGMAERGGFASDSYDEFDQIVLADSLLLDGQAAEQSMAGIVDTPDNAARADEQADTPIQVIVTNPPWSAGVKQAGDATEKLSYPDVVDRVRATYGKRGGGKALGNLYVQAMRWMTDRLSDHRDFDAPGIVAFVHPNSLANAPSLAGARAALRDEFTDIYVINLRGNAYAGGGEFKEEGDKIFGAGSRNGVQITVLVRNPAKTANGPATLHYAEVPAGLRLEQKVRWLGQLDSVANADAFKIVPTNDAHDWVNQTDGSYFDLLPVCVKGKKADQEPAAVAEHALGIATNLDTYAYAFSRDALEAKIERLIAAYDKAQDALANLPYGKDRSEAVAEIVKNADPAEIKWTGHLRDSLNAGDEIVFDPARIREVMYRPFTKLWLYEDDRILSSVKTVSALFQHEQNVRTMVGGGVRSSLPARTTAPSSARSQRRSYRTSARSERTNRPAPSRAGDRDDRSVQPNDIRDTGDNRDSRPAQSGRGHRRPRNNQNEAIIVKQMIGSRGDYSTPLAVSQLVDLHFHTDGGARALPRSRP